MLKQQLERDSEEVLKRWRARILETYPDQTARFLASEKDEFANPIGHAIHRDTRDLLSELTAGLDLGRARRALEGVVRIRAVQGMPPSEAIGFIPLLKDVVRERAALLPQTDELRGEVRALEADVDKLLLASLDVFVACRESIHDVAQSQLKSMVHVLIERANRGKARDRAPSESEAREPRTT
ncbi:MAG: RsbRD N-terminal domain-containing protein [Deltaproteobacteria bacterium]|nr:RsbRD N-terminal domain-containing protein [Deltaproteobacteria bacterium]